MTFTTNYSVNLTVVNTTSTYCLTFFSVRSLAIVSQFSHLVHMSDLGLSPAIADFTSNLRLTRNVSSVYYAVGVDLPSLRQLFSFNKSF